MENLFSRREFVKGAAAVAAAPFAFQRKAKPQTPNILLIIADELSANVLQDKGMRKYLKVPNLDALAERSVSFSRAYAATPLCAPARTAMFTGSYPIQNGIETNEATSFDAKRFPCLATFMRDGGYDTAYFGKWHLPYPQSDTKVHGFEFMHSKPKPKDVDTAEMTLDFVTAKRDAPFFAVASFVEPHNICDWPRGGPYDQGDVGHPPAEDELPPLRPNHAPQVDEPEAITLARRSYQAAPVFPVGNYTTKQWREYLWGYYRMIERADLQVGRLLQALEQSGKADSTVIIFLADHGDSQGAHLWNQKTVFYEEASRVPLFICYPGKTSSRTFDRLVNTGLDLFTTICSIAHVTPPAGLEGRDLLALAGRPLHNKDFVVVTNYLVQGAAVDGVKPMPHGRMLRTERYKYEVYDLGANREALVDLVSDPGETMKSHAFRRCAQSCNSIATRSAPGAKRMGIHFLMSRKSQRSMMTSQAEWQTRRRNAMLSRQSRRALRTSSSFSGGVSVHLRERAGRGAAIGMWES